MLASFFQFSFLCVVAIANLCLGFVIASRLGFGPSIAALFELEPVERGQTFTQSEPLESSAPTNSDNDATADNAEESLNDSSDDTADAVESTNDPVPESDNVDADQTDSFHGVVEDVFELLTEREASVTALMDKLNPDDGTVAPADAEAIAEELTEAAQEFLQKLNSMTDVLNQQTGSESEEDTPTSKLSERLSDLWSEINDSLVQTVVLNYDEASINDSVATLKTTIEEITGHCKTARQHFNEMLETVAAD